jgi:hypothetical protein
MTKLIFSIFTALLLLTTTGKAETFLPMSQYEGSSFAEVVDVIEDHNFTPATEIAKDEFAVYQNRLPQYPMNTISVFFGKGTTLERDAQRTVNEGFDYYDRLPKKLHPNGVCVTGEWQIQEPTKYSGYFANGAHGLFVGRISVAMEDTTSDDERGFGIAGKVFPTLNPQDVVKTGNFFTVDVLMGTDQPRVLDTKTTNEPELGFKFNLLAFGMKLGSALKKADESPMFRPLTKVAELNSPAKVVTPHWIRLSADRHLKRNNEKDFRNEVLKALEDNKKLIYNIEVSDTTKDRSANSGWKKIGEVTLDRAIVSYGCDRRLHFAHPKLK